MDQVDRFDPWTGKTDMTNVQYRRVRQFLFLSGISVLLVVIGCWLSSFTAANGLESCVLSYLPD